jgi:ketosteroid isomerase-like protein
MKSKTLLVLAGLALLLAPGQAQENQGGKPPEDPAHEELRKLKRDLVDVINKGDIPGVLAYLDKDVVVTWMNGEVSKGPDEVKKYLERMTKGDKPIVKSYKTDPTVDDLTHLYGDKTVGVAYGHSNDTFVLNDGKEFTIGTRWSATLVKKDGKWLIANFHGSADVFDNPVLDIAIRKTATYVGIGAGIAGLLVGAGLMWLFKKR